MAPKTLLTSLLFAAASMVTLPAAVHATTTTYDTVAYVELERFMGPWYVQGHTPMVIDDHATNQVETYTLNADGSIGTTFTFERYGHKFALHPIGTVADATTNAHWKMQFLWPFSSDYLIVRLAADYSITVVSVPDKSLIWIMSRTAQMDEAQYTAIVAELASAGYPVAKINRVQQDQ